MIARSQRERDVVRIPADDDCERGNHARFCDAVRISWWTRTDISATLMHARIAPLRIHALIGSTIERRVSSGAMFFGSFNESLRCRRFDVSAYKVFALSEDCVLFNSPAA
jgi:hypothetical protein